MKQNLWLLLVLFFLNSSFAYGYEAGFPASQIEKGKYSLILMSGSSAEKLNFRVTNKDEIKVGNNSYFSEVSNDFESDGKNDSISAKLLFNPHNGLYYWLKAGSGNYGLEIPSATVKNRISGQERGCILGFGARKLLFPDTIVSPAIAAGIGVNYSRYGLDTFRSGDSAPQAVNDKLEITEFQADVVISKKLNKFEPYGGLKIFRKNIVLTDKAGFSNVSGTKDNAGLFFGARLNYFEQEALLIEASFIGEASFNAGISIVF